MRTVAIIAAHGQLGSALVAAFAQRPDWQVRPLTRSEGHIDITDMESVRHALDPEREPVDVVINPAFWPGEEPEPALQTNTLGPRLIAERCAAIGATLVQISTDYVFAGDATSPYKEDHPADACSVYGISKAAGEQLVRAYLPSHLIVRVASLFGPVGSRAKGNTHFVSTILNRARRGEPLRVVADQYSSPTYAPDAAEAIRQMLDLQLTGTYHVANSGSCSWYQLATAALELSGIDVPVEPIQFDDLPATPPRPRYSVLGTEALQRAGVPTLRPWQDALREYVATYG